MAQLVASVSGVVLGGVAMVVGSNLARLIHYIPLYIYISAQLIHYIPLCVYIYIEAKYLQHLSAQLIHYIPLYIYISTQLIHYIPLYNIYVYVDFRYIYI